MIVQDDTTDNVLKYRAKIKANIAATDPSIVLDDQRELADYVSGPDTQMDYKFLLANMEHSVTGINGPWLPCGVLIS